MSKKIYELKEAFLKKQHCFVDLNNNILFSQQDESDPIYPFYIKRHDDGSGCVLVPMNTEGTIDKRAKGTIIFKEKPSTTEDGAIIISANEYMYLFQLYNKYHSFIIEDTKGDNYNSINDLFNSAKNTIAIDDLLIYKDTFVGKYIYIWDECFNPILYRCVEVKKECPKEQKTNNSHFQFIVGSLKKNLNVKERYKFFFANETNRMVVTIDINQDGEVIFSDNVPENTMFVTMNAAAASYDNIRELFKEDLTKVIGVIENNMIDNELIKILNNLHKYHLNIGR